MKANNNQIKVIKPLKICLDSMVDSNDISSPTHLDDIETLIRTEIEDYVDDNISNDLIDYMQKIYWLIRKIK